MYRNARWAAAVFASALIVSFCASKSSPTSPTPAAACSSFSLSTRTLTIGAAGGPAAVTVTTDAACAWTSTSDHGWMRIVNGASGTGNGVVNVELTANANEAPRAAILTIGAQTVSVEQAGATPCSFTITPSSAAFTKDAANGGFDLTTADACNWTAVSSASWVTVSSPHGTGSAHVTFAVARNADTAERKANISIADRSFSVTQAGDSGACEYSVAPVQLSACMASPSTLSTTITTAATCPWTVAADSSWMSLQGGTSGTGSSVISFTLAPNFDAARTGKVMVRWPTATAGQNVVVSQAGCHYAVSTSSIVIAAAGGTSQFDVLQESDPMECGGPLQNACQWTATSNVPWITVTTSMPQAGDNPVHFTVAPNGTGAPRTGTITVRDKSVTINQGA